MSLHLGLIGSGNSFGFLESGDSLAHCGGLGHRPERHPRSGYWLRADEVCSVGDKRVVSSKTPQPEALSSLAQTCKSWKARSSRAVLTKVESSCPVCVWTADGEGR